MNECHKGLEFVLIILQKFKAKKSAKKKLQDLWLRFLSEIIGAIACLEATSLMNAERYFYKKERLTIA